MALILDTGFLIAHCFPKSERERIKDFSSKISKDSLIIPSIVIVEFMKIAYSTIGLGQAKIKLRLWIGGGAEIAPIDKDIAFLTVEFAFQQRCSHSRYDNKCRS